MAERVRVARMSGNGDVLVDLNSCERFVLSSSRGRVDADELVYYRDRRRRWIRFDRETDVEESERRGEPFILGGYRFVEDYVAALDMLRHKPQYLEEFAELLDDPRLIAMCRPDHAACIPADAEVLNGRLEERRVRWRDRLVTLPRERQEVVAETPDRPPADNTIAPATDPVQDLAEPPAETVATAPATGPAPETADRDSSPTDRSRADSSRDVVEHARDAIVPPPGRTGPATNPEPARSTG